MSSHERFVEQERRARALSDLGDLYAKVARHLSDGRPALAEELCRAVVEQADALGEDFTTTQYPVCLACAGTGEMQSPSESDRKVRCQDVPRVCQGNRFGRMHPVQMQDFMERAAHPKAPEPPLAAPAIPDENLSGDMKPTPIADRAAPPYIYSREAVIEFNRGKVERGEPEFPIPGEDEELLAHADGSVTVRKLG